MRHHKLIKHHPKIVRDKLNEATDLADQIHQQEQLLIQKLFEIDQQRFYVRYGFKSLSGFCLQGLKFSKTQTQMIVIKVRRYDLVRHAIPVDNIRPESVSTAPPALHTEN